MGRQVRPAPVRAGVLVAVLGTSTVIGSRSILPTRTKCSAASLLVLVLVISLGLPVAVCLYSKFPLVDDCFCGLVLSYSFLLWGTATDGRDRLTAPTFYFGRLAIPKRSPAGVEKATDQVERPFSVFTHPTRSTCTSLRGWSHLGPGQTWKDDGRTSFDVLVWSKWFMQPAATSNIQFRPCARSSLVRRCM